MERSAAATNQRIGRRTLLRTGAAFAAAGPALPTAAAAPAAGRATASFAYVGAFTTPERKAHGDGINVYRIDPPSGVWGHAQLLPMANPSFLTLDRERRFLNTGAEIAVAPSGRFVYGSNRGHDSIAIFAVDRGTGTLRPVGWAPTRRQTPRFFTLDPAGVVLYAANQDSDTIAPMRIDPAKGALTPTGQTIKVANPVSIVFA